MPVQQILAIVGAVFGTGTLISLGMIFASDRIVSVLGWVLLFSFIAFAAIFGATYSKDLKIKRRDNHRQ